MNWLFMETLARFSVEHIFNAIPAGFVIAFFAWTVLRFLPQNSGTRFAVWFVALVAIFTFPLLSGFTRSFAVDPAGFHRSIILPQSWAYLIFTVWAFGASVGLIRLVFGVWRMQQLRRGCPALDSKNLHPMVSKTVETIISASSSVVIATSDEARVPSAIGLWRRTIVLPSWTLHELPPADLNAILIHEFAHLRRGDDWTNLVQKIVKALFFFHPAVWWLDGRLSTEREMACDDAVLAETGNPHGYANCLVSLLERSLAHKGWSMAQAAVHRAREASLRLAQILSKNRPAKTSVWMPAVGMVGIFSVLCLAASSNAPQLISFGRVGASTTSSLPADHISRSSQASKPSIEQLVVPARLNVSGAVNSGNVINDERRTVIKRVPKKVAPRHPAQLIVAGRFKSDAEAPARILAVRADAAAEMAPQVETLMFVETTQYGYFDGPMVVRVWSVTLIRAADASSRIPVANSI